MQHRTRGTGCGCVLRRMRPPLTAVGLRAFKEPRSPVLAGRSQPAAGPSASALPQLLGLLVPGSGCPPAELQRRGCAVRSSTGSRAARRAAASADGCAGSAAREERALQVCVVPRCTRGRAAPGRAELCCCLNTERKMKEKKRKRSHARN